MFARACAVLARARSLFLQDSVLNRGHLLKANIFRTIVVPPESIRKAHSMANSRKPFLCFFVCLFVYSTFLLFFFSVFILFFGYHFIIIIVIFSFRAEPTWEAIIASKDEAIAIAKDAIASKNETIASKNYAIAKLNTELIVAKGLVEPRCVNHVNSFV